MFVTFQMGQGSGGIRSSYSIPGNSCKQAIRLADCEAPGILAGRVEKCKEPGIEKGGTKAYRCPFPSKLDLEVIHDLKNAGFNWSGRQKYRVRATSKRARRSSLMAGLQS
jgi:hypothetical protein